jgi:hypothetical protein
MSPTTAQGNMTTFQDLPLHLQRHILASAAVPLTVCKASASIVLDAKLSALWMLSKHQYPLQKAIQHRMWDVCDQLLGCHQYVPQLTELQWSLPRCAAAGRASLVMHLLKWCCEGECTEDCGTCGYVKEALVFAAYHGHMAVCSILLEQRPGMPAAGVREAICTAALSGHNDVLDLLMTIQPDASAPNLAYSPMCHAAAGGRIEAMQLLLRHGADLHNSEGSPWSCPAPHNLHPLEVAAYHGQAEAVRWLLDRGVSATQVARAGTQAKHKGHFAIACLLLDRLLHELSINPNRFSAWKVPLIKVWLKAWRGYYKIRSCDLLL